MRLLGEEYRDEKSTSAPTVNRVAEICRRVVGAIQEKQRVSEYFGPRNDLLLGHWPVELENYFNSLLFSKLLSINISEELEAESPAALATILDDHFKKVNLPKRASEYSSKTKRLDFSVRKRYWCSIIKSIVTAALGIPPEKKAQHLGLYDAHKGSIKSLQLFVAKKEKLLRPDTPSPPSQSQSHNEPASRSKSDIESDTESDKIEPAPTKKQKKALYLIFKTLFLTYNSLLSSKLKMVTLKGW